MNNRFFWPAVICLVPFALAAYVMGMAIKNYSQPGQGGLRFNMGVDLAGGTILVYEVDKVWWQNYQNRVGQIGGNAEPFDPAKLASVLKKRLDPVGLREIVVRPIGGDPPRVEIILPVRPSGDDVGEGDEAVNLQDRIREGSLEFRLVASQEDKNENNETIGGDTFEQVKEYMNALGTLPKDRRPPVPEGLGVEWKEVAKRQVSPSWAAEPEGFRTAAISEDGGKMMRAAFFHHKEARKHYILTRVPKASEVVRGEDLTNARAGFGPHGKIVEFSLTTPGAARMYNLTVAVKHHMAIVLDDRVESYPTLQSRLSENGQITVGNSADQSKQVDDLVNVLNAGKLEAPLNPEPVSVVQMGPGLGQDTIQRGSTALVVAFLAVVLFMVIYYRFAGGVASFALLANLVITVGFMIFVKATFTLPGLAGLVLMLGMAVDANVLIYERFREERERGASLALAIRNGYDRALPTIIDTHLTSIFTCIVLYIVGNDQLKGFGISLTVGLLISLFTSLYITHTIFDYFLERGWLKDLTMMRFLNKPSIDFMKVRYQWFTATIALSILGLAVFVLRGEKGFDIDFTGGTGYHIVFKEPIGVGEVRRRLGTAGLRDVAVDTLFRGGAAQGSREFFIRTTLTKEVEDKLTGAKRLEFDADGVRERVSNEFKGELQMVDAQSSYRVSPDAESELPHQVTINLNQGANKGKEESFIPVNRARKVIEETFAGRTAKQGDYQIRLLDWVAPDDDARDGDQTTRVRLDLRVPAKELETRDARHAFAVARTAANNIGRVLGYDVNFVRRLQGEEFLEIHYILSNSKGDVDLDKLKEEAEKILKDELSPKEPKEAFSLMIPGWVPLAESRLQYAEQLRVDMKAASEKEATTLGKELAERLSGPQSERLENFDPQVAGQTQVQAMWAILLSWGAICMYLWFRFGNWTFGMAAVLCLIHDLTFAIGLIGMASWVAEYVPAIGGLLLFDQFKLDLASVAALLTLVGYSVNDTIVIFDRIREVRGKNPDLNAGMINDSVNATLSRTLLTSFTTWLVVLILYLSHSPGIHLFSFVMVVGVVIGTYSSIFVASPLLLIFGEGKQQESTRGQVGALAKATT